LKTKPKTLGLAAGRTPIGLYQEIAKSHERQLFKTHFFHLDEFVGADVEHPPGFAHQLNEILLQPLEIPQNQRHFLNGRARSLETEAARYETEIKNCQGIDLQILGLGTNGHLAFNEPGSDFRSRTRVVSLSEETKKQNQSMFGTSAVPDLALTMGLGTILEANEIWIFVTQEQKKNILNQALSNKPHLEVPASCLQFHENVTLWTTLK
jgi:glucosamine-6-phosphate deaminase